MVITNNFSVTALAADQTEGRAVSELSKIAITSEAQLYNLIKTNGKLAKGYYYLTKDMNMLSYGKELHQLSKEHKGAELIDSVFDGRNYNLFGLTDKGLYFGPVPIAR